MDHQQLNYLDSKIIFFFDSDGKGHKLEQKKTNRSVLISNHNHSNLSKGKQNSRDAFKSQNKTKRVVEEEKSKEIQIKEQQHKQMDCLQFKKCSDDKKINNLMEEDGNKVDNKQMILDVKNEEKGKQKQINNKNSNATCKLSHHNILLLFGEYHKLYQIYVDYLIHDFGSDRKQLKKQQKCETSKQSKNNTTVMKHTQPKKINQYIFKNDRAPIVNYIKETALKDLYEEKVKQNFQNSLYIDKQFSNQLVPQINKNKVQWIYISPQPSLHIFPQHSQSRQLQIDQQLPFVNLLKCLYQVQFNIFTRLVQPPINNVFSVWLFCGNGYRPVFIDGYFPNNYQWKKWFQCYDGCLWLPIFIKCICKIYRSYDHQILKNISDGEIYTILYGQRLNIISINQNHKEFKSIVEFSKKKDKKFKAIIRKKGNQYKILEGGKVNEIKLQQKQEGNEQTQLADCILYSINQPRNWYIYSFPILIGKQKTLDLSCQQNTKLVFPLFFPTNIANSNIQINKNSDQQKQKITHLTFHHKINEISTNPIKLTAGSYKIICSIEGTIEKKQRLNERSLLSNEYQEDISITIMSSSEVKIGQELPRLANPSIYSID